MLIGRGKLTPRPTEKQDIGFPAITHPPPPPRLLLRRMLAQREEGEEGCNNRK